MGDKETEIIMDIKKRVAQEEAEIIKNLTTLVSYDSVNTAGEGYPFGKNNADCLNAALKILDGYGFKTKNLDNYAGYGEIGEGKELIGMVGHLDVVPVVKSGWTNDPFTLTLKGNDLYGRGSSDDKGPVCCAIAALRIVKEMRPELNKRLRIVMGCNEESGSACLDYYVKKEGDFDYGFTPDGSFPGVYGEKGNLNATFKAKIDKIKSIKGGEAPNVVCGMVTIILEKGSFDEGLLSNYLDHQNVKFELDENDPQTLKVYGHKAHASTPDLGVNAISEAMVALDEAGIKDPLVKFYATLIGNTCHGERMGIDQHDQYGELTFNVGMIHSEDDQAIGTIDIRYPVTKDLEVMRKEFLKAANSSDEATVTINGIGKPLFYAPDSPLVKTLLSAYQEVTGDKTHLPITMGGGTYAKGIKNTIAFGGEFPDDPDIHMHGDDEFIPKENLLKQTEIYVLAILKLLEL